MTDEQDKLERQARLSKALSAAYLTHQITQLEDRVQSIDLKQNGQKAGGRFGNDQHATSRGGKSAKAGGVNGKRYDTAQGGQGEKRYILDTSVLIFSLPAVRALLDKPMTEIIVPLEVLRTLDILKKSMHPVSVKARQATRFIDQSQQPSSSVPVEKNAVSATKRRTGLYVQGENESNLQLALPSLDLEVEEPVPAWAVSTLQCVSFFLQDPTKDTFLITLEETDRDHSKGNNDDDEFAHVIRYGGRARGAEIKEAAERFQVAYELTKRGQNTQGQSVAQGPGRTSRTEQRVPKEGSKEVHADSFGKDLKSNGLLPRPQEPPQSRSPVLPPASPRKAPLAVAQAASPTPPASPPRGGLTREALERSQALLYAQEMDEQARRREIEEKMARSRGELAAGGMGRGQVHLPPVAIVGNKGQNALLTRPRSSGSGIAHPGRAAARMDKDGVKLLRPESNGMTSHVPIYPAPPQILRKRSEPKRDVRPGRPAGQIGNIKPSFDPPAHQDGPPKFVLLQRPK